MRKLLVAFSLLAIPALVGVGVYWQRTRQALPYNLAVARAAIGMRGGHALLDRLGRKFPDSAEMQFLHARQLEIDRSYDEALICLDRALALGWPRSQVERQRLLVLSHSDFRKMEPFLQSLVDANPDDREAQLAMADGYLRLSRSRMAETIVNRLLDKNPDDGYALCLRGQIRESLSRADLGYEDLKKSLELCGNASYGFTARYQAAICLHQLGKLDKAYELLIQCRDEHPNNTTVLFELGLCARRLNRPDESLRVFYDLLKITPSDVDAQLQVAYIYDERKDYDRSLAILQQIESEYPDEPQMLVQMAKTLKARGQEERARVYEQRYAEVKKKWDKPRADNGDGKS